MSYIFMDESGDLGFNENKKVSKNFLITFLFVKDKKKTDKQIRNIFAKLPDKIKKSHTGVFHSYREKQTIRMKILNTISQNKDNSVMVIRLNKEKIYTKLQEEQVSLYNYATNILLDRIFSKRLIPLNDKIVFIQSKRETNRFLNNKFKEYIISNVEHKHNIKLDIQIKTPAQEKGLQATDCISWSIFRKYEYNDESYYSAIKDVIVEDYLLYK